MGPLTCRIYFDNGSGSCIKKMFVTPANSKETKLLSKVPFVKLNRSSKLQILPTLRKKLDLCMDVWLLYVQP